jgi:hypothetical protein
MSIPIETTVERLFRVLEARKIRYAVLRNYEHFPSLHRPDESSPHTDIDLVVNSRDLDKFRQILSGIAELDGWDALTECDHWARSPVRHHNIEVFRFYRLDPLDYLQIDVFHGLLIWSFPLFSEQQLLSGRLYDHPRSLTRVDPLKENVFRLFQIAGHYGGSERKVARYRRGILAFRAAEPALFDQGFRGILSNVALEAVDALERSEPTTFLQKIRKVRFRFVMRSALRNPLAAPLYVICRLIDHANRFLMRQCGCAIKVYAPSEFQRGILRRLMSQLVDYSFIDHWKECEDGAPRSWHDHLIMEQGAIVIEWTGRSGAHVDLSTAPDRLVCACAILSFLVARHKRLYCRPHLAESVVYEQEVAG